LADVLDASYVELDAIFHQPDWIDLKREEFQRRVKEVVQGDRWVIDGNYSAVWDIVWGRADTVVWLDPPYWRVMTRVIRRTLRRVIMRTELWNGNREPLSNLYSFNPQKSIIAWSAAHFGTYRERYGLAPHDPRWSGLRFVRLATRAEARDFLQQSATRQGGQSWISK
jgi:hypothetical protein